MHIITVACILPQFHIYTYTVTQLVTYILLQLHIHYYNTIHTQDLTPPPSVPPKPVPSVRTKPADNPPPALPPKEPTTVSLIM